MSTRSAHRTAHGRAPRGPLGTGRMNPTRAGPQTPGRCRDTLGAQTHTQKHQNTHRQGPEHACHSSHAQKSTHAHSEDVESARNHTRTRKNIREKPVHPDPLAIMTQGDADTLVAPHAATQTRPTTQTHSATQTHVLEIVVSATCPVMGRQRGQRTDSAETRLSTCAQRSTRGHVWSHVNT